MTLTRADLETGRLQKLLARADLGLRVWTEAELQASIEQTLRQNPSDQVWVFAYGSLIWNPVMHYLERQVGKMHGWHRRFCLWTPLGRGTPENPGLMLGLDRGGCCRGIVYQIAPELVRSELLLLWRREMVVGSYIPRWVKVNTPEGSLFAIAFLINRSLPSYAGELDFATTVHHLATAQGELGSAADYLDQTVTGLKQAKIYDRGLLNLQRQVMAQRSP
ncbi:MAG: gamma-glutamylcyclotransferase [Pegethrix bostrychoides GSE-TBD4-15B]|jgi:cation transport protein ChaC|uniref:glutathione-specific gamma-glutamylcyclotransferase n=1 Tax=Pegethrix bostrychoides GSE-TBD4-15B TaxID=2839662 RepID=A0A951PDT6_9CYAN|nr:gamma-glutamylcyclotransferase [Pegethrix bostrychoides GSE-TBD4-15B]